MPGCDARRCRSRLTINIFVSSFSISCRMIAFGAVAVVWRPILQCTAFLLSSPSRCVLSGDHVHIFVTVLPKLGILNLVNG